MFHRFLLCCLSVGSVRHLDIIKALAKSFIFPSLEREGVMSHLQFCLGWFQAPGLKPSSCLSLRSSWDSRSVSSLCMTLKFSFRCNKQIALKSEGVCSGVVILLESLEVSC